MFKVRFIFLIFSCFYVIGSAQQWSKYVNPFIGTGGHGHTYPGPSAPFGMIQPGPDTRLKGWDGCSGYHYSDSVIYGFSHTHLSGTGIEDYCDILFMPGNGIAEFEGESYASPFRKKNETATAGYYKVLLDKHKITAELTTAPRTAMHRYTFSKAQDAFVLVDLAHRDQVLESWLEIVSDTEIRGMRRSKSWAQNQTLYFHAKFSKPFINKVYSRIRVTELNNVIRLDGRSIKLALYFDVKAGESVLAKVGISGVSAEGAKANLDAEIPHFDFDKVKSKCVEDWEKELSKIAVEGGTKEQMEIFYTALYHTMLCPNLYMDVDGKYRGTDDKIHQNKSFTNYTVFSLWDTYRALHPLLGIIDAKRSLDFVKTFLKQYENGGMLPVWELSANETFCMIGYHSVSVIADLYNKGIKDFDTKLALKAMTDYAESNRFGIDIYAKQGFLNYEDEGESVSKTLEYAYDDWCIAQFAKATGNKEVYEKYMKRALSYRNLFDPETGFMRGRTRGTRYSPFNPTEVNILFTEGNSWQYSFYVPQDIAGLANLHGGREKLIEKLNELFSTKSALSGREQSDITGLVGQYAHGNEPSHHMAYLYNYLGQPHKTQELVYLLMNNMYSTQPDGLIGNEDCGQMSAWYVMSALGIYPLCPGSGQYAIATPMFKKAIISLENGKKFVISREGHSSNFYIQSATLNGAQYQKSYLNHNELAKGGVLHFTCADVPSEKWGKGSENEPQSEIKDFDIVIAPVMKTPASTFKKKTWFTLTGLQPNCKIYYTLDGSAPSEKSTIYKDTVWVEESSVIKFIDVHPTLGRSAEIEAQLYRLKDDVSIKVNTPINPQYTAGGAEGLIDGIRGLTDYHKGGWQSHYANDFEAVVDLGSLKKISEITATFLQDVKSWIWLPQFVEFYVSRDDKTYELVSKLYPQQLTTDYTPKINNFTHNFQIRKELRYVKVFAKNFGKCPDWHDGFGGNTHIFIDEIMVK